MKKIIVGFAICGSFCTIKEAVTQMKRLVELGYEIYPIMSPIVFNTDNRFNKADDLKAEIENICSKKIIHTVEAAEPIGPKKLLDILLVAPCTGNTLAKLALGITDTSVTMAVKAHLRNGRPVVLAPATNDGLSGSGQNIGRLQNCKNIFFVPYGQDDANGKPTSLIADFEKIPESLQLALEGKQIQPILI